MQLSELFDLTPPSRAKGDVRLLRQAMQGEAENARVRLELNGRIEVNPPNSPSSSSMKRRLSLDEQLIRISA